MMPTNPATANPVVQAEGARVTEEVFLQLSIAPLRVLTEEQRRILFSYLDARHVQADELVCSTVGQAHPPGLWLVVTGEVLVSYRPLKGRVRPLEVLGPGGLFGAAREDEREPLGFTATATTNSLLMHLPAERALAVSIELPELARRFEVFDEVKRHRHAIVPAMRRMALLSAVSPRSLGDMLADARILTPEEGDVIVRHGDDAHGFFYVIEGELSLMAEPVGEPPVLLHIIRAGTAFGDVGLLHRTEPATVKVRQGGARLLHIPAPSYRSLLERSRSLHRSIGAALPADRAHDHRPPGRADVALVVSSVPGVPLSVLTDLLGQAAARELGDRVLVVQLDRPSADENLVLRIVEDIDRGDRGIDRIRIAVPDGAPLREAMEQVLLHLSQRYDLVLVDAMERGPSATGLLSGIVQRVAHLTDDTWGPLPPGTPPVETVIGTALLGRMRLRPTGPAYRAGTVRVRLDLDRLERLGRLGRPDYLLLTDGERAAFGRWARALTDRRVGVALGGGGAWGYAHVALLRALLARKIPIDVVSGASFGSVVGAYFAARGEAGLELLLEHTRRTRWAIQLGMVNNTTVEWAVGRDLGGPQLEDLDVPFFPCSTNIGNGAQKVITRGAVGRAVRASGSFPGAFAATRLGTSRLVDGAIVSNIPDEVLIPEGTFLVVASNIVAEPPVEPAKPVPKTRAGRVIADLNPVQRLRDLVRGSLIMLHAAGDLDASQADYVFEPEAVPWMFWDTQYGREIADRAIPRAEQAADWIEKRWRAMCADPRGEQHAASHVEEAAR